MTLRALLAEGRLRAHRTTAREVADLLGLVDRDLADAGVAQISADRRFATAYNAALQLATVVLHAAGYRATGTGHHWATLQALPEAMSGTQIEARADYLNQCRSKRNVCDYDRAGAVSDAEAAEILTEARSFRDDVRAWLRLHHPDLLPRASAP